MINFDKNVKPSVKFVSHTDASKYDYGILRTIEPPAV